VDSDFEGAVAALDGMFPVCRPAPAQWVSDASIFLDAA
jgi:hypothetical protein